MYLEPAVDEVDKTRLTVPKGKALLVISADITLLPPIRIHLVPLI
jgi:hypothetical protein